MFKILVTGIFVCIITFSSAQEFNIQSGPEVKGLANIRSVSPSSIYSTNNNPAYLIEKERKYDVGLGFYHMYNLTELNASNLLFTHRNKNNGIGFSLSRFGNEAFKRQYFNLAYAHGINNFSLGFRNTIQQIAIEENGSHYFFNLDFGCKYVLSEKVNAGILISNITRGKIDDFENFDPEFSLGISYQASSSILLLAELQKKPNQLSRIAIASQYNYNDILKIRIGITPKNLLWTTGFGVKVKTNFSIDISYQLQETLGSSYILSLVYSL